MRRGTRVGQAYIALTADGSGINDDIADSMDDVDFNEMGDRHGKQYSDAMREHTDRMSDDFRDMARRANEAFDNDNDMSSRIIGNVRDAFNKGDLDSIMREVGGRTGTEYGDSFSEALRHSVMEAATENLREAARRGELSTSDMFRTLGQDEEGAGGFSVPGPRLAQITDQAEAKYRRGIIDMEKRIQSDRDAVWRMDFDRHAAFEREFTELLAEEAAQRLQTTEDAARRENRARAQYEIEFGRLLDEQDAARLQSTEDTARRRNQVRAQYEAEFSRLLDAQDQDRAVSEKRRDEDRFRRFDAVARRLTKDISIDPRIDTDKVNASFRRLRTDLEAAADITLRLKADMPLREREKVKAELESIRARIKVSVDEESLNRSLLRAQGIAKRAGKSSRGGDDSDFGKRLGRMFGGGSRNNALNLVGSSIGNIAGMLMKLPSLASKATAFIAKFQQGMAKAGEGASMMSKMSSGAGEAMAGLGSSVTAGAVAIPALILAASLLVSVLGALLAIAVALSATIVSGLTAAVVVGAGAFAALGAAAGLATIAFTSMTNAQKKMLSEAFKPLKAELTGIGQLMLGPMVKAFGTWSKNIQMALLPLAGIAHRMGQAFAQAGNILTASLSGPGFQAFIQSLGVYLPSIITRLSTALGGFLNGMMGLFAAIMPMVNRFAGYLAAVGARFSAWANSAQGRNTIADWVDRAVSSLVALWNAAKSVMGFITDLLFSPQAQNAGNTMFDSIARTFEGFRRSIAAAAADGSLQKWFDDAIRFGSQLWSVIQAIFDTFKALYDSGVLAAIGDAAGMVANLIQGINKVLGPLVNLIGKALPAALTLGLAPLYLAAQAVIKIGEAVSWVNDLLGNSSKFGSSLVDQTVSVSSQMTSGTSAAYLSNGSSPGTEAAYAAIEKAKRDFVPSVSGGYSIPKLRDIGSGSLGNTYEKSGGYMPDPTSSASAYKAPPEYKNPYVAYANSLIKNGPSVAATVRNALITVNKEVASAIRDASKAMDSASVKSALASTIDTIRASAEEGVNTAQQALSTAASSLASASSASAAAKALREVHNAQKSLTAAQNNQFKINGAAKRLAAQKVVDHGIVKRLVKGTKVLGATMADYAAARERMAKQVERANEKLDKAVAKKSDYKKAVVDSIRAFGAIMTATAQTVNGVQQALTATDITKNLQDKLQKIRDFRANLRILLAQGLSRAAYKQLVDGGAEEGSAYVEALVAGGTGAVGQVNDLTRKINNAAGHIGKDSSKRLYQAGVDAAQGLVKGLESQSRQLDRAGERLGNRIARSIKRSLKINSPSQVLIDMMNPVGDGAVVGLDNQHSKVDAAASRFAGRIAVSPEVAEYAAAQRAVGVSQNPDGAAGTNHTWNIVTPTENPKAVAREAINEMTARL